MALREGARSQAQRKAAFRTSATVAALGSCSLTEDSPCRAPCLVSQGASSKFRSGETSTLHQSTCFRKPSDGQQHQGATCDQVRAHPETRVKAQPEARIRT